MIRLQAAHYIAKVAGETQCRDDALDSINIATIL